MENQNKKKEMKDIWSDYLNLVFDMKKINTDEYIRVGLKNKFTGVFTTKHFNNYKDILDYLDLNRFIGDLYVGTGISNHEKDFKEENIMKRSCLIFDFDKKDYFVGFNHKDVVNKFKTLGLFYHMLVDSGNGYHAYVFTEPTNNISRLTEIYKNIAQSLKADINATLSTQLIRIPYTLNFKTEKPKISKIIVTAEKIRRYSLEELERRFVVRQEDKLLNVIINRTNNMYCINEILKGVPKGHRNFCLGRLIKYFQFIKETKENSVNAILEWNEKCNPPKEEKEILRDFENYWNNNYKLLGCNTNDERMQSILSNYCDKYNCNKFDKSEIIIIGKTVEYNNKFFKKWKDISGNHLIILSILNINKEGLNTNQLKQEITSTISKKPCMSKPTLVKVLNDLVENKFITCVESKRKNEPNFYIINDEYNKYRKYTEVSYHSVQRTIDKAIKPNDFKVYVCMKYRLKQGKNVTMEELSKELGIDMKNIHESIHNLEKARYLKIKKDYTINNMGVNIYEWLM